MSYDGVINGGSVWAPMPDLGDIVSYQQKMREQIARAEELEVKVQTWQEETTDRVRKDYADDLATYAPGTPRRQRELFLIEEALRPNRLFNSRARSVDKSLKWAQVYALAAIAEASERQ